MAKLHMNWRVWSKDSAKDDVSSDQLYIRMKNMKNKSEENSGICLFICNKHGKKLDNGNLLTIEFQTQCIILHEDFDDDYKLKTNFDGTALTTPYSAWESYVNSHNEGSHSSDCSHSKVKLPDGLADLFKAFAERNKSDSSED